MKNKYEIKGDVTVIYLSKRDGTVKETFIDTLDLPLVLDFPCSWYVLSDKYVVANKPRNGKYRKGEPTNGGGTIGLHRWILQIQNKAIHADHIDHDGFNNRRSNLRETTIAQNAQNRSGCQTNSLTGIRGVTWSKEKKKWQARIRVMGKEKHLGWFSTIEEADKAASNARAKNMPYSVDARMVIGQ